MRIPTAEALIVLHEGVRLKPYRCPAGKLTIGVGRNLEDTGITEAEAYYLLSGDIERVWNDLDDRLAWWPRLNGPRQAVLLDMAFNLGVAGLLRFRRTLRSIELGNYSKAAAEMLESKWARQVGGRAERLAEMMRTGEWPSLLTRPVGKE